MPQKVATAVYCLKSRVKSSCEHVGNRRFSPCLYLISMLSLILVNISASLNYSFVNKVPDVIRELYVKKSAGKKKKTTKNNLQVKF